DPLRRRRLRRLLLALRPRAPGLSAAGAGGDAPRPPARRAAGPRLPGLRRRRHPPLAAGRALPAPPGGRETRARHAPPRARQPLRQPRPPAPAPPPRAGAAGPVPGQRAAPLPLRSRPHGPGRGRDLHRLEAGGPGVGGGGAACRRGPGRHGRRNELPGLHGPRPPRGRTGDSGARPMTPSPTSPRPVVVLTPVRNEAWILARFLAVTARFADLILVADQGSTDGSAELCRACPKV